MDILGSCRNQHHLSVSVNCEISFFVLIHRSSASVCSQLCVCMCMCVCVCVCVCLRLVTQSGLTLLTQWMVAQQAPLSMGFSRQEYWTEPEFPVSPALQEDFIPTEPSGKPSSQLHSCSNTLKCGPDQALQYYSMNPD